MSAEEFEEEVEDDKDNDNNNDADANDELNTILHRCCSFMRPKRCRNAGRHCSRCALYLIITCDRIKALYRIKGRTKKWTVTSLTRLLLILDNLPTGPEAGECIEEGHSAVAEF